MTINKQGIPDLFLKFTGNNKYPEDIRSTQHSWVRDRITNHTVQTSSLSPESNRNILQVFAVDDTGQLCLRVCQVDMK